MQQEDFEGIFEAMQGLPVTIRLLDPPLHEFLPNKEELLIDVTKLQISNSDSQELKDKEKIIKESTSVGRNQSNARASWMPLRNYVPRNL